MGLGKDAMKILLADKYLRFCGQVCNKRIAGGVNVSMRPASIGAARG
jgi:hypothetical protein